MTSIKNKMSTNNLAVISQLADMGDGEVEDPDVDLPKVGHDDSQSAAGRIIHWDTEWHWDPVGVSFAHKALGGHIVALGLTSAQQVWNESTYQIFDWADQRGAVAGFAHFEYLDSDTIPTGRYLLLSNRVSC